MDFRIYEKKGLSGLKNLGNTCFINSAIQILSHTYEFIQLLENELELFPQKVTHFASKRLLPVNKVPITLDLRLEDYDFPEKIIVNLFAELIRQMWEKNTIFVPDRFIYAIRKYLEMKYQDEFSLFSQNDITEFLNIFFSCFDESLKKKLVLQSPSPPHPPPSSSSSSSSSSTSLRKKQKKEEEETEKHSESKSPQLTKEEEEKEKEPEEPETHEEEDPEIHEESNFSEISSQCFAFLRPIVENEYSIIKKLFYGIFMIQIQSCPESIDDLHTSPTTPSPPPFKSIVLKRRFDMFFMLDLPIPFTSLIHPTTPTNSFSSPPLLSVSKQTTLHDYFQTSSSSSSSSSISPSQPPKHKQTSTPVLPPPPPLTLYDCLDSFFEPEILDGDNMWYNDKTKEKQKVITQTYCWSFPVILIINLKRFHYDGTKIMTFVDFPFVLDLTKYTVNKKPAIYELYAVSNHERNHYYSYIKTGNKVWRQFNDDFVSNIPTSQIISKFAYSLFYRKIQSP